MTDLSDRVDSIWLNEWCQTMERESSYSERSESTAKSSIQKFPDWIPGVGSAKSGGEDRRVLLIWNANPKSLSYDGSSFFFSVFPSQFGNSSLVGTWCFRIHLWWTSASSRSVRQICQKEKSEGVVIVMVEDKDWWRADLHTAVHCSSTECCLNKSVGCSRLCINALKCQRKCWEVLPARITLTEKYHDASLLIKKHGILWISKQHFLNKHMRSCIPPWCF